VHRDNAGKLSHNDKKAKFIFDFATKICLEAETFIAISGVEAMNESNRCSQAGSQRRMP
jgi:hypothetical protein